MEKPSQSKSYLDILNECDNFPLPQLDLDAYLEKVASYYHFRVSDVSSTLGFALPFVVDAFRDKPGWIINDASSPKTIVLAKGNDEESRSAAVASTLDNFRQAGNFKVLKKWRNELKPVYGPNSELLFSMERSACPLLGIVTYGIQLTAFTRWPDAAGELMMWVSRRAKTKSTYPGMLDNTVAGGMSTGEVPFDTMIREAHEEASLSASIVKPRVQAAGTVAYFHSRDERAGGEAKLLQPEIEHIYEVELPADVIPKPCDDEVEGFQLWDLEKVKKGLTAGEFKPSYALIVLDFLIRHGVINQGNEPDFVQISSRLHRLLEFPLKSG